MTDISDIVVFDDHSFPLEIMGRDKEGKPVSTGVTFDVRDLDNKDSQKELKKVQAQFMGRRLKSKDDLSEEETGTAFMVATTDPTDEMLAHCVTGWDWGGKTLGKCKLTFSHENVIAVFKFAPWIRQQVLTKVLALKDFTTA